MSKRNFDRAKDWKLVSDQNGGLRKSVTLKSSFLLKTIITVPTSPPSSCHHARAQSHNVGEYHNFSSKFVELSVLIMYQVIDNSGALVAECINVLRCPTSRGLARIGE
jgi:hypothetical protein